MPSIITAAVSLTGARESELSESRLDIHTHAHLDHEEVLGLPSVLIRLDDTSRREGTLSRVCDQTEGVLNVEGGEKKPDTCGVRIKLPHFIPFL